MMPIGGAPDYSATGVSPWMAECQALFFDLDGTLVDSALDIHRSLNMALTDLGLPQVSVTQVRNWVGRGASRLVACVLQGRPQATALHEPVLTRFMQHYQTHVCVDSVLYPGVRECLEQAQAQRLYLACITNKPYAPARQLLEALDLSVYFPLMLGGDSLEHKKPHPQPLQHALAYFGLAAHQALMVGDSRNDVEAAHAAGMRCVAVPYGYNHGEDIRLCGPDYLLDSLDRLF